MDFSAGFLLDSVFDVAVLAIIGFGIYRLLGQQIPRYRDAKALLVLVLTDVNFGIIVAMDLLRNFYPTDSYMDFVSIGQPVLLFANAILLMVFSYVIYVRPPEPRFVDKLKTFMTKMAFPHGMTIVGLSGYTLFLDAYLIVSRPFRIATLPYLLGGGASITTVYSTEALVLFIPVVLVFGIYRSVQLYLVARKLTDTTDRRRMFLLVLGWSAVGPGLSIGPALITFNVLAEILGYNGTAIGFLIVSIAFLAGSTVFRGASVLPSFFGPVRQVLPEVHPFTDRIGKDGGASLRGGATLMLYDPKERIEEAVGDFVVEKISSRIPTYILTPTGSPIHAFLSKTPEARFFLTTESVSYSKPGSTPFEMLIPRNDHAVTLDLLERTISSNPGSSVALVFDSVSDLISYDGVERAYKFMKQINEILGESKVTALFLMTAGAADDKPTKLIMGLFQTQLQLDASGLRVTK